MIECFLRRYLQLQGYAFGIGAILGVVIFEWITQDYDANRVDYLQFSANTYTELRYVGIWRYLFHLCWILVSCLLIVGVFWHKSLLLYPFLLMYCVDLYFLFMRDVQLFYASENLEPFRVVIDPVIIFIIIYGLVHVLVTLIALHKLFRHNSRKANQNNKHCTDRGEYYRPDSLSRYY
ncbi:uncharacterized protein LOC129750970 [Uranotaenia lowii]|uniref:uncharacterized protein LOC129750970 n=1 Tax=Uranotaenia lowii TaxID=190385 RepID=UPI002479A16C|nr:uncharacterized protein LOC129750970 [Uranotaenia lowii]